MVRIGRWWFQRRSVTPLPLFVLMVALPPDFILQGLAFALVLLGVFATEGLRLWAVGFAGSATRTRGDQVPVLVHAGPFRFVRNPLYIANTLMYTLAGVLFGFGYLSALVFLFSIVQYTFIVAFEEDTLVRTFGKPYEDYCLKVPRWIPALSPKYSSSAHTFSFPRALKSEKSTLFSMLLMAGLFAAKQTWLKAGN